MYNELNLTRKEEWKMESIHDLTDAQIYNLQDRHNKLVKSDYISENTNMFMTWVDQDANFDEDYIEISSNETLSGHAEILDLTTD